MTVRWTRPAAADLTDICDYTRQRFGAVQARRAALLIYDAVDGLRDLPSQGRAGRKPGTREIMVAGLPFPIIYRLRNSAIEILRVLHGAQQWP